MDGYGNYVVDVKCINFFWFGLDLVWVYCW